MKQYKVFVLLVLVLSLSGCMSIAMSAHPESIVEPSKTVPGATVAIDGDYIEELGTGDFISYRAMLYFSDPKAFVMESDKISIGKWAFSNSDSYWIQYDYSGPEWRFMESLDVAVDGQVTHLVAVKPNRQVVEGGVTETLFFVIPLSLVDSIKMANRIQLQYFGSPVEVDRSRLPLLSETLARLETLGFHSPTKR